ncbi:MAG: phosphoglycerate dehydrogenase [Burkholderiales bacterium]|nr:phosphoglycerate dehydrogenase [Phycisphaerae bacterium]
MNILVADKLAEEGLEFLTQSGVSYDVKIGLKEDQLAAEVPNYDGLIVRSGVKATAKVLANPGKLRAIARAGVGVDNIDLEAATSKGILVLNTAAASTLSTAEHALALMFSLARKIPAANHGLRSGELEWKKRSIYQGTQLAGKTLGVVGLGRIGQTVASRAIAMEMKIVGYDPYFPNETALDGRVKMIKDFDEFLRQIDVITFHVPGGEQTRHLLNRERLFNVAKPNLLVINDSRGEVVDEIAIAEALNAGKIAGAALDVFQTEPPAKDHPLFSCENVVLTPHLGASTDEAQTAVSVEACRAMVAFLQTGEIRGAVNAGGVKLDLPPDEAPLAKLASRIGSLLAGYAEGGFKTITLRASGPRAPKYLNTFLRLATVELLKSHLSDPVNVINVEHIAQERGIEMVKIHEPEPPQGLVGDIIGVRVQSAGANGENGESHRILGTVYADGLPRVLRFDNFVVDMVPEGDMVIIENEDKPGVIGVVGTSFGDAGVNIADMVISRHIPASGEARALMVLKVDSKPDDGLINRLKARPGITRVKTVKLPKRDA